MPQLTRGLCLAAHEALCTEPEKFVPMDIAECCWALRRFGFADEKLMARMHIELFGGIARGAKGKKGGVKTDGRFADFGSDR